MTQVGLTLGSNNMQGYTLEELQKMGGQPVNTGGGFTLQELQSMQSQQTTKKDGWFKTLIKDPIKTLLVQPAARFTEAVGRSGILGKTIQTGFESMADESQVFNTFAGQYTIDPQKTGIEGARQIIGDVAKSASYLYTGGAIAPALTTGGRVSQGLAQGAKVGAIGGGAYSFGDALQDAEAQPADIAMRTLFGTVTGGVLGGVLGAGVPLVVKSGSMVRKFSNIESLNGELQTINNTVLRPTPSQSREWAEKKINPIKTYTEIFATEVPSVDKSNRFTQESIEEFVGRVDDLYKPGSSAFNTILRNSPEVTSLSVAEINAIKRINGSSLTSTQKIKARAGIQAEFSAIRVEYAPQILGGDNIPVALTDNLKDISWGATKYFGAEEASVTNEINRTIGRVFAKQIDDVITDTSVNGFNKQLQELIKLKEFLGGLNGKLAGSGGKMTRLFSRVIGGMAGSVGGIPGTIAGSITGDMIAQALINPANSPMRWLILQQIKKLPQAERQTLLDQANVVLQKMFQRRSEMLRLPAPSGASLINQGRPTKVLPAGRFESTSADVVAQNYSPSKSLDTTPAIATPQITQNINNNISPTLPPKGLKVKGEIKTNSAKEAIAKGMTEEQYVKEHGTPLYHGTNAKFDKFDVSMSGEVQNADWGDGIYFTDNPAHAKNFAKVAGGDIVMERFAPNVKFADGSKLLKDSKFMDALDDGMGFVTPSEYLKAKGFGGVKYKNPQGFTEYVVYDPNKLKTTAQLRAEYQAAKLNKKR